MFTIETLLTHSFDLENKLGYKFKDFSLLITAFTHRSYANEYRSPLAHNERLEFLGDSILGLIIAEHLYRTMPTTPEGTLSLLRSRLVEAPCCANFSQKLDLDRYILLGKGERMSPGRGRETILADLFEAIIGAIFLDGGLESAKNFVLDLFQQEIQTILQTPERNWKALLQDFCQKIYQKTPLYIVTDQEGPDHSKVFKIIVSINDQQLGCGEGNSKKEAQQAAAADALTRLKL